MTDNNLAVLHCYGCDRDMGPEGFYPSTYRQMQERGRTVELCRACRAGHGRKRVERLGRAEITRGQGLLRARKRVYVEAKKVERGCARCGECHPACLEWHHIDASIKDDSLARMVDKNRPFSVLDAEMDKCEVLCSNCHRKSHWEAGSRSKYIEELRSSA